MVRKYTRRQHQPEATPGAINTTESILDPSAGQPAVVIDPDTPDEGLEALSKEQLIALLRDSQQTAGQAISELERVKSAGDTAALLTSNVIEVHSHTDLVRVEVSEGKFEDIEKDFWKYTLDLPPSAGEGIKINGMPAYHGQLICVDTDTLRYVKAMVFQAWYHEQSITGTANDNAFRRGYANSGTHLNHSLSGKGAWAGARA
jgi:hypothetical protein